MDGQMCLMEASRLEFSFNLSGDHELPEGVEELPPGRELMEIDQIKVGDAGWGRYRYDNLYYRCIVMEITGGKSKRGEKRKAPEGMVK